MMTLKHELKKAVLADFGQFLLQRGFRLERDGKDKCQFRRRGDARDDLIEVQFDKHNRPKFVLNFGSVPLAGLVDSYGRYVEQRNVQIMHLIDHGRLHRYPHTIFWFRVEGLFGFRSTQQSVAHTIRSLIRLFAQVDCWFETGEAKANIKVYRSDWNEPGLTKKSMQSRGLWPPENWTVEDESSLRM